MSNALERLRQPVVLPSRKKVYFASDFHLGAPDELTSRMREHKIIRWLESIRNDAYMIFLLGDTFDFWFEYRHTVPKGFIRFLGKLAEIADQGIALYFFTGNHDMWMFDYFPQALGVPIVRRPMSVQINDQRFYLGHGDGLGRGDYTYKVLKKIFTSRACQRLFATLHPNWGMALAKHWSAQSRRKNLVKDEPFRTKEDEWIYQYCAEVERREHHDYYIFGHRHLVLDLPLGENSRYVNTGEWFGACHYAGYDGQTLRLLPFET